MRRRRLSSAHAMISLPAAGSAGERERVSHTIRLAPNPDPGHEIPLAMATAATLAQPVRLHLECAAGGSGVDLRGTTLRAVRVGELSGGEVVTG